jgi:hypothetical protein
MVTDNCANQLSAVRKLKIKAIACSGQSMHLSIRDALLSSHEVQLLMQRALLLVEAIQKSPAALKILKDVHIHTFLFFYRNLFFN